MPIVEAITIIITCIWYATSTIAVPPEVFDHPYSGKLSVVIVESTKIHEYCKGNPLAFGRIMACTMVHTGGECTIVLPALDADIVSQPQQDRLRRHELGHCNGWLGDHLGGRLIRD